jgi:hypothetical protein
MDDHIWIYPTEIAFYVRNVKQMTKVKFRLLFSHLKRDKFCFFLNVLHFIKICHALMISFMSLLTF